MDGVLGAAATHAGKVRADNQDSYLVQPDLGLFAVADGMGGHAGGQTASRMAIESIGSAWSAPAIRRLAVRYAESADPETRRELLVAVRESALAAHRAIVERAQGDDSLRGMGTTFTGFLIAGGDAVFAHVGDSRAYLVRDRIPMRLSEDHTVVAQLLAAEKRGGSLGYDTGAYEGVLTGALGVGEGGQISVFRVPLYSGDRLVLCSDGVHQYVGEVEVGEVVLGTPSPARAAQQFVDRALAGGGADNATAVVCKVVEAGVTRVPADRQRRDDAALEHSQLLSGLSEGQRERFLRIAVPRHFDERSRLPAVAVGERVVYLVLDGAAAEPTRGRARAGDVVYADALLEPEPPAPSELAVSETSIEMLMVRRDDFIELLESDGELAATLRANVAAINGRLKQ